MIAIKCHSCGTLFGYENEGVLNIKRRDLFRQIEGRVKGPCIKCGAEIIWPDDEENRDDSGTRQTSI